MMIYGQSLRQVFDAMPGAYKIVVSVCSVFFVFILFWVPYILFFKADANPTAAVMTITGIPARGMSDPSVVSDGNKAYMAYTSITKDTGVDYFSTVIAQSNLPCKAFQGVQALFQGKPGEDIVAPDGQSVLATAQVRYETPSIIYDPTDKGREWKVFSYRYYWAKNIAFAQRYGVIAMKTAASPRGPWSAETWLFSPGGEYPPAPYNAMVGLALNTLHPDLANMTAYSRPSALVIGDTIVMTLSAFRNSMLPEKVIMIASGDHGRSWNYIGTPLTLQDAAKMGVYKTISGASLLSDGKKIYLAAVLGNEGIMALGTQIIPFADPVKGLLQRDENGVPVASNSVPLLAGAPSPRGGGYAAYTPECKTGLITSEYLPQRKAFHILKTYRSLQAE